MNPETCPYCGLPIDGTEDICPFCGKCVQIPITLRKSIKKTVITQSVEQVEQAIFTQDAMLKGVRRPKIPVILEIGMTLDKTESSKKFQQGIPKTIQMILQLVAAKAKGLRVYFQVHGDLDYNEPIVLLTNGGSPQDVIEALKLVKFEGGGDPDETHLDAIEKLFLDTPWTCDPRTTRSAIIAILNADTKPARSGISARALGEEIKSRGIMLYLICEPTPTLQELVDGANGFMFKISNDPDIKELQIIAAQLAKSITENAGKSGTVPMSFAKE